jgi:CubicO group peptidase (beta-lactamase class C family)
MRNIVTALALAIVPVTAAAQASLPRVKHSGFSAERLARIDRLLQQYVDDGKIPGAVAFVSRGGVVVYEKAVGWADREAGRRMTADAVFRIASQTKALTSVAIMMLVEEGKLGLGDAVSRYMPTFSTTTVASPGDSGRGPVAARRPITIKHLLTHTAGISYGTDAHVASQYQARGLGPAAGYGWYTADKSEPICETMDRLGGLPFVAQPGEAYVYGYNTDVLGCVVERASGMPLDTFIRTRITGPLRMRDTHFFLPPDQRARLTAVYASDEKGGYGRAEDGARGQGHYVEGPRRSFAGGAGMLSTARDYARFLQMLLNGGSLDGVRLLSPKTVDVMTSNQVGSLFGSSGLGFGLGFQTNDVLGADGLASLGTYGWGGAYGSLYKVDPKENLVIVFMIQLLPNRTDIRDRFPTMVYAALQR